MTDSEAPSFALPTGTVTFLLSDVEGPTQRWERAPEAMARAIARHYELLDAVIVRHGGVRQVEQGEGDSMVGAFSRASDAVAAAVEAQQAFAAEPWPEGAELPVRIAVHTGEAQLRDQGNYLGHVLNRGTRLRAAAHGGQVLLSAPTAALVVDRLPEGVTLLGLGVHRLKDLGRPEQVWQVTHSSLPLEFPPLKSVDRYHQNLPTQLTPLIGRTSEVAELVELLANERAVTLTGSAGVGKTRLALAVGAQTLERYAGGVWWVELASLSDPGAIGRATLAAIGAREVEGVPLIHQLAGALDDAAALVVLDNCEHLIDGCAGFVAELVGSNAAVSVLATSREPLGVPGEVTWRVPSLRCLAPQRSIDVTTLSQYDALVLFADRARRARPSFVVNEDNAPAVAEICHRLDGIPLAIELAAARCRQLSAERIAAGLDDRFRLLIGGARTVMPRQQTLAASIDWSHERLDDEERLVFRRLGVFNGVFPLEAAESVTAAPGGIAFEEVFDVVSRLVDKSLVVAGEGLEGEPRYRLLDSLRAYAIERARTTGELTALRDAHASWWTAWLEPTFAMPTDGFLGRVEEFHDNLHAALEWTMGDPPRGLRLLRPLARAWTQLGRYSDAIPAADRLLGTVNAQQYTSEWLAAADPMLDLYLWARGPAEWHALLDRIEDVATEAEDEYHLAVARYHRAGREETRRVVDLARQRGDHYLSIRTSILAARALAEADPADAEGELSAVEALVEVAGNRDLRERMLAVTATAARCTGDLRRCLELSWQLIDDPTSARIGDVLSPMSFAALLACDEDALRGIAERARMEQRRAPGSTDWTDTATHRLELFEGGSSQVHPDLRGTGDLIVSTFGTLWLECREAIDAGSTTVALDGVGRLSLPVPHGRAVFAAVEAAATDDESRWHDALCLALTHQLRLIAVDALEGVAVAASRNESWSESLRLFASADRLRDETGYRWRFNFEQQTVDAARATARNALGDEATQAADAQGRDLDWREAADYARRARGERKRPHHGWASLTPMELQVVAHVADGLTNPQIAERLFISRATVKTHLEHIFVKLGVRRRSELAAATARRIGR